MFSKKISLFLMVAIFLVSLYVSPVLAPQQEYHAFFLCRASGECLVAPEWGGGPLPDEWSIGRGSIFVAGSADVDQYPSSPPFLPVEYYFTENNVKSYGGISARWNNHMISVFLYSKGASGLFVDEGELSDTFIIGFGAEAELMFFKGIFKDPAGYHFITGKAAVMARPPEAPPQVIIQIVLIKPDGTPFLGISWVLNNQPLDSTTLQAADVFINYVKIKSLF